MDCYSSHHLRVRSNDPVRSVTAIPTLRYHFLNISFSIGYCCNYPLRYHRSVSNVASNDSFHPTVVYLIISLVKRVRQYHSMMRANRELIAFVATKIAER